jgi:hypothetical protein
MLAWAWYVNLCMVHVVTSIRPKNAYKDMLDNVISHITCVSMNHQNQLEQMTNGVMFATARGWERCGWGSLEMFLEFKWRDYWSVFLCE